MRIASDVYFQKYGNYNYLRHVGLTKDFLMNEICFDILEFVRKKNECSIEEVCEFLKTEYEVEEVLDFENDIKEFIEQLVNDGIIIDDNSNVVEEDEYIRGIVQQKCFDEHRLFTACLELTYRCNEKCIHCYVDTPYDCGNELSTEEIKNVIKQLKELGCMGVLLTGGEATLRKDFFEIAEYVKQMGMLFDVYTNGLAISDEAIDRLIELKPNSVSFSFYGGTPDIHDKITKVQGSFEKSLRTLLFIKCSGIDTYIKTVIMKDNVDDYENLLKLGKRINVPVLPALSIMPSHGGKTAEPFRLLDKQKYLEVLELEEKYRGTNFNKSIVKRGKYICASGLDSLSIDPFGGVHPCNAHPMEIGNVRNTSLEDIWENSEYLKNMRKIRPTDLSDKCSDCADYDWCSVCMGSALRENEKLAPCSDTCMIADAYHCMYKKSNEERRTNI